MNLQRSVLIVDDDADYAAELQELLECYSVEAARAGTLAEALALIGAKAFSAVLLDRYLGRENGLDLIAAARAKGHDPLFIIVTGDTGALDPNITLTARAEVLLKPLAIDKLLNLLNRG